MLKHHRVFKIVFCQEKFVVVLLLEAKNMFELNETLRKIDS